MNISAFDLFAIGIGPSSSHTVGPMKAAQAFAQNLELASLLSQVVRVQVDLYGSLALTGKGHGTHLAILNGLEGQLPRTVDPDRVGPRAEEIINHGHIMLAGSKTISFNAQQDLLFHYNELLPLHTNGMRFTAFDQQQQVISEQIYYSIGGGFIVTPEQYLQEKQAAPATQSLVFPFATAAELLAHCHDNKLPISAIMLRNEQAWRTEAEVRQGLLEIANIMQECIVKGCQVEGYLPGGLNVKRRAASLYQKLRAKEASQDNMTPADKMLWPTVYAMAVNEENAAGGRVVTAPTNGAAGIVPAVLEYYRRFIPGANDQGIIDFLLTAAAIAILYKKGASISGAEVGCQGEVGVACSMAAAALTAVLGGTIEQIENAAEIGMEHHLGLTCDPVAGLVQVPCIERNGLAADRAIKIAELVMLETGEHIVSLDKVIETMMRTGRDMNPIYKETSRGGLALAVNVPEC